MNWPSVSIGIPTWNRAGWICRAVDSVLAQDYRGKIEVVVADDGSTDSTADVLACYGDCIKYVASEHRGIAHAKNVGLTNAAGDVRGLLDDDDWYEPQFVRRCVEVLLENRGSLVGVVYVDDVIVEEGVHIQAPALDWNLKELLETCNLRTGGWLGWWSVLNQTGLHDERLESDEDYDLMYKLAGVTELLRIPEPLHFIQRHSGCMTSRKKKTAFWHAAVLAKHGFPVKYAAMRAERHGAGDAWNMSITDGYNFGKTLRENELAVR